MLFSGVDDLEMLFGSPIWARSSSVFGHELIDSCTVTVCSSICLWRLSISSLRGKNKTKNCISYSGISSDIVNHIVWLVRHTYLSCRRQLCRLLRGSLFTEVDGFNNSSKREAGTGQSGILTGVTGLDGFPSLFSSMRCCARKFTAIYLIICLQQTCLAWHYTFHTGLSGERVSGCNDYS